MGHAGEPGVAQIGYPPRHERHAAVPHPTNLRELRRALVTGDAAACSAPLGGLDRGERRQLRAGVEAKVGRRLTSRCTSILWPRPALGGCSNFRAVSRTSVGVAVGRLPARRGRRLSWRLSRCLAAMASGRSSRWRLRPLTSRLGGGKSGYGATPPALSWVPTYVRRPPGSAGGSRTSPGGRWMLGLRRTRCVFHILPHYGVYHWYIDYDYSCLCIEIPLMLRDALIWTLRDLPLTQAICVVGSVHPFCPRVELRQR